MLKKKNELHNINKKVQITSDIDNDDHDEEKQLDEILPDSEDEDISHIVPTQMMVKKNTVTSELKMTKGIFAVRKNFVKIKGLKGKLINEEIVNNTKQYMKMPMTTKDLESEKILLEFDKGVSKVPSKILEYDFGYKIDNEKRKDQLDEMLKDVRKKKRKHYLKELQNSKNKEKTYQRIVSENMVMFSERKMLLKGGDKNRFAQRELHASANDVHKKDEKMVFNRVSKFISLLILQILKMMYTVITLLFLYALTFIFVYLLNSTYYEAVRTIF